jgi:hypothetical protein
VLDPSQKWTYFEEEWKLMGEEVIANWKLRLEKFYANNYRDLEVDEEFKPVEEFSENTYVAAQQYKRKARIQRYDELKRYLSTPTMPCDDPLQYWLTQRELQPALSQFAIDTLSAPTSACEIERYWSSCKLTMSDKRNRITVSTLEAIEQLRSWLKIANYYGVNDCDSPEVCYPIPQRVQEEI